MYRRFTSPGWIAGHLFVLAAALTCLRLGWWQWDRSQQAAGDAQNLGYALLWPAFAGAFIYMWLRFLHLETLKDAEDRATVERDAAGLTEELAGLLGGAAPAGAPSASSGASGAPDDADGSDDSDAYDPADARAEGAPADRASPDDPRQRPSTGVTIAVATVGDDDADDDPELTAYNRALAALAEEDRRRGR